MSILAIEHINEFDTLNAGREKINKHAIDPANRAELNSIDAKSVANQANQTSQSAEAIAINTDDRLDNIIAGEMQDGEVIDARRPFGGDAYPTLGERLDSLDSEKAEVSAQLSRIESKLLINISDFPRLVVEVTDDGRFTRALNSFDKGTLQLGGTTYVVKNPPIVKDYQQLNGVYGATEINLIDGGDISNNSVVKVAPGRDMFWVSFTNLFLTYHGTRTDIVGIDLSNSNQLNLENIYIKGAFYKGIIGSAWLANISNVTAWCDYDFGHTAFEFKDGTSVNLSTVWSKNFARGFNLGSLLYSSLDSCAVDTFSVYAYDGGQGVSYNGCGAEDAKLVKGGYVWGNIYRSVGLTGCQIMNIGVSTGVLKGETSVFHSTGARMSIKNFRQQDDFNDSDMIDILHALSDSQVAIENSSFMSNYNEFVKMDSDYGEVTITSGYTKTVYNFDKRKQVALSIEKEFYHGFKKVSNKLVEGNSFNATQSFLAEHVAHRNTHMLYTMETAKSVDILSCKTDSNGVYSVNINLDISVVNYSNTPSSVRSHNIKGIVRSVNGVKQVDPIVNVSGNESHGITVAWSGDTLKVTLGNVYAECLIETTVYQAISSGRAKIEWL